MALSLLIVVSIDSYAQKFNIMSMNIDSTNTVDQNISYGYFMGMHDVDYFGIITTGPAIVLNVSLINNTTDTLTILTQKAHSYLRYEFNGKKYTKNNTLGIFSDDLLPGEVINISPQQTLEFQLLFGLLPEYAFSVENYAKNIWQIIPTLQIELELHRPKGMTVVSEPLNWKSITISGE